jgi:menaquinone-dependent protoporphyrinogen oxidase
MKLLVTVASKHGATGEIGEIVSSVLRDAGHDVDSRPPHEVDSLDGYNAVVLGSAIYAGRWMDSARRFVDRHAGALTTIPVWLFTSGPIGDPPLPADEAAETAAVAERVRALGRRSFAGRLDQASLGFLERTVTKALRAPNGDFRDWEAIRAWADEIAGALRTSQPSADRQEVRS